MGPVPIVTKESRDVVGKSVILALPHKVVAEVAKLPCIKGLLLPPAVCVSLPIRNSSLVVVSRLP